MGQLQVEASWLSIPLRGELGNPISTKDYLGCRIRRCARERAVDSDGEEQRNPIIRPLEKRLFVLNSSVTSYEGQSALFLRLSGPLVSRLPSASFPQVRLSIRQPSLMLRTAFYFSYFYFYSVLFYSKKITELGLSVVELASGRTGLQR